MHLELVVKFTTMMYLGFNALNCKMEKEPILLTGCHKKNHVRVDVEILKLEGMKGSMFHVLSYFSAVQPVAGLSSF